MTFNSKIDMWLILVIALTVLISATAVVNTIKNQSTWLISIFIFCVGIALPISLLTFTRYEVTNDSLQIRSGPYRWSILLSSVKKIEASRSSESSPALSLDRLKIDYAEDGVAKSVLVSPSDPQGFLNAVEAGRNSPTANEKKN